MVKLLECPFCGSKRYEPHVNGRGGNYRVECGWCGAESPEQETFEEAINVWNDSPYKKIKSGRELTQDEKNLLEKVKVKFDELSELMSEVKLLF